MPTIYGVHSRQGGRETKTCPTAQIATRGARKGGGGARLCQPLRSRLGGRGSTEAAIFGGDAKITVASRGPPVGGRKDPRLGEPPPPRKRRLGADAKIELLSTGNSVRRSFSTRFFFCSRQFFVEFYLGRENPRGIVSNCFSSLVVLGPSPCLVLEQALHKVPPRSQVCFFNKPDYLVFPHSDVPI